MNEAITRPRLLVGAAALLCMLVAPIAASGAESRSNERKAKASAKLNKKVKKLTKQVKELQGRLEQIELEPGPPGQKGEQGDSGAQGPPGSAPACAGNGAGDEMVAAGAVCIDKYEVSVWSSPTGGTQYGADGDDYPCNDNGQNCTDANAIYARSVPGVTPSRYITYFQAQQALSNSGKRLATNDEWQQAVAGTPDPGGSPGAEDCNTNSAGPVATGSRANCVSNWGANDMVGNLDEWVGDWTETATGCDNWPAAGFGTDLTCLGSAPGDVSEGTHFPAALLRGGEFLDAFAGPFAVFGRLPSDSVDFIGFRGAR